MSGSTTTYVNFTPGATSAFQFQATFDGTLYIMTVRWNFAAQRWFIEIDDQFNNLIVNQAMVGSPSNYDISLTAGFFTTKLVYRVANAQFEIIEPAP